MPDVDTSTPDNGADDAAAAAIWAEMDEAEGNAPGDTDPPDNGGSGKADTDPDGAAGKANGAASAAADTDTSTGKDTGTAKAGTASEAVDIWANATPEQRAAFEATRTKLETTETNHRRVSGTVSGQQRKINDLERQLADALKGVTDTPKDGASGKAKDGTEGKGTVTDPLDDEQWAAFEKDYPDLAEGPMGAMRTMLKKLLTEHSTVKKELGGISEERRDQYLAEQDTLVHETHKDYDLIAKSPDFVKWYETAPAYLKAGIERNADVIVDGSEVTHIVSIFKSETGWKPPANAAGKAAPTNGTEKAAGTSQQGKQTPDPKRERQLESASQPRTNGGPKVNTEGEATDREAIWNEFEREDQRKAAHQR